jgi:hypothetical protein
MDSTLRLPRRRPSPSNQCVETSSHRLWLPYRVSPVHHRDRATLPKPRSSARPFRGLFPFSVFTATQSHLDPVDPNPSGSVAPSGFLTLSTLCSPRDLPGLFHPDPAHGVLPSRPWSSHSAVRPLGRRFPHGVSAALRRARPPPPGIQHAVQGPLAGLGIRQVAARGAPLGSVPSRVSCLSRWLATLVARPPLSRFVGRSEWVLPPAPQGIYRKSRCRSLSRPA